MALANVKIIVIGGLNTDIIGHGVNELLGPGELTLSGELRIGPGGKSRNIAQMIAAYLGKGSAAMIGRTCRDPYNLWQAPLRALEDAGVNTDYVKVLNYRKEKKFPGVALIPVDKNGRNQVYVLPGVNADFSTADLDEAAGLFESVGKNKGVLALSLELPLATAVHAFKKAAANGIKIVLDPGGIDKDTDYGELLAEGVFLLKPNEHEAHILSGVEVNDMSSAAKAASKLSSLGIENMIITHGARGAYLFGNDTEKHIPIPRVTQSDTKDETGCGDQVTAVLAAELASGGELETAAATAVRAGTLQFYRSGIEPVSRKDLS